MKGVAWWLAPLAALTLNCRPPAPPSPPPAPPASGPTRPAAPHPASGPGPADCGPAVEGQIDAVRAVVVDDLIRQAVREASEGRTPLGPIVLAEEQRLPNGQSFVKDVAPDFLERFAGRTPPVANYSSAFLVEKGRTVRIQEPIAFATGRICWTSPTLVLVDARKLSGTGNRAFRATVEQRDGSWTVTSLGERH